MKLKSLNCSFLSDTDILRLNNINIQTSEQLVTHTDLDALSKNTNIPLKHLKMIRKFIIGQYSPFPETGDQILNKYLKKFFIIPTGCKQIDDLISNGIYSSEITEVTGPSSSGKTQFCFNLIANMYKTNPNFTCLFIDSTKNFCLRRIFDLLQSSKSDYNPNYCNYSQYNFDDQHLNKIFQSIKVFDCKNIFNLMDILFKISKTNNQIYDDNFSLKPPNLIIIDDFRSLFNLFSTNSYLDINYYLSYISSYLKYLSLNLNTAIVITTHNNQNVIELTNTSCFNNIFDSLLWKSVPNLIIQLSKSLNDNKDNFKIIKCNRPFLNESNKLNSCFFKINESGLI